MKNQNGFTLIELVIVIVLLGVLSAIAIPRFVNLEDDAQRASLNATAAAMTSAMNINYAECAVNSHTPGASNQCRAVDNCDDVLNLVQGATGYAVTAAAITGSNGATLNCTVEKPALPSVTATFVAIRAGT